VPPSGELHEELGYIMGTPDPKRRVQRLMDSTAHAHGPAHRGDPVHSLGGIVVELAKRGELTPANVLAAQGHILQDKAFDAIWRALPVKGPYRQAVKNESMRILARTLRQVRKGRR
jgi:hypothetical protein